jgi:site-specific DNA-adenine methylase
MSMKERKFRSSIFSFIGGKYYLLKHLLPFPEHQIYLETFAGSGVVLLNKIPVRSETYNDINGKFVNYWNVLRDYHLFLRMFFNGIPDSRTLFNSLLKGTAGKVDHVPSVCTAFENALLARNVKECKTDEDVINAVKKWKERDTIDRVLDAFTHYYLIHHSFSFKGNAYNGMSLNWKDERNKMRESFLMKVRDDDVFKEMFKVFKVMVSGSYNGDWDKAFDHFNIDGKGDIAKISWVMDRIKHIRFDCQDFRKIIPRFDRKGVLMYLDPPYFQSPDFVAKSFTKDDHGDLLELLKGLKNAKFVLSIDEAGFYNEDGWYCEKIIRNNCAGSKGKVNNTFTEYIIRNFNNKKVKKMNENASLMNFLKDS